MNLFTKSYSRACVDIKCFYWDTLFHHIYPDGGVEPDAEDGPAIYPIGPSWMAVRSNAACLLGEGRSNEEILGYLKRYLRLPDDYAARELTSLKRPFRETYAITYHAGRTTDARTLSSRKAEQYPG